MLFVRWHQLIFLLRKEIIATLKDKRMRILLIMPAIIQGFIFGYAANYNLESAPIVIVDNSHSSVSRDITAKITGSGIFKIVAELDNSNEIKEYIEPGKALAAITFPLDFAERLARGEKAPLQVILNGQNSNSAGLATGYLSKIIGNYNHAQGINSLQITVRTWYNPNQLSRYTFLPGLIAMISFVQVILLAGLCIAKEREQGTFDLLLVAPIPRYILLIGKAAVPIIIGLVQSTFLFIIVRFYFAIPLMGSVVSIYAVILVFNIASTGIGLSLSAIAKNMQQVLVYVLVTLIPMSLLSGLATPISNMPQAMQLITYASPLRFALEAVRRIYLEGAGMSDLLFDFVPLILISMLTLPLAAKLFNNRIG